MSDRAFKFDYEHEAERLSAENAVLRAELEVAESALLRKGYRKTCDIAACNCGSQWNHGGHAEQRLSEIGEALRDAGFNGGTLLGNIETVCAERDALEAEVAALRTNLKGVGLFLRHCWCDVQMNEYSFGLLNQQMQIVDAAIDAAKEQR